MIRKLYIIFPVFLYLSCTSLMEKAKKNASENSCPSFGMTTEDAIKKESIFTDPISKTEMVFTKDSDGTAIPVSKKDLTQAKDISQKDELSTFLAKYKAVCGKDAFPPYFEEIAYVKDYRKEQQAAEREQEQKDLAKARSMQQPEVINKPDSDGKTPLMLAAERGQPEVVRELLQKDADPKVTNSAGDDALSIARKKLESPPNVMEKLLKEEIGMEGEQVKSLSRSLGGSSGLGAKRNYEEVVSLLENAKKKPEPKPEPTPAPKKEERNIPKINLVRDDCGKGMQVSKGPHDGRFTLGLGKKRLMFGYPLPLSTSHFVVKIGKNFASNYAGFGCRAVYITGTRESVTIGKPFQEIRFQADQVEIRQKLIPVDASLQHVGSIVAAQYYRIEYELINKSEEEREIGLLLLIDTMIEDTDANLIAADGKRVRYESTFLAPNVPKKLRFYGTSNKKASSLTGEIVNSASSTEQPGQVSIGNWPYLHPTLWNVKTIKRKFRDTAVVLKWEQKKVAGGASRTIATHYGLAKKQAGSLATFFHSKGNRKPVPLQYGIGGYKVSPRRKKIINAYLKKIGKSNIMGVVIEGYADALGDPKYNLILSGKRAAYTKQYMVQAGIPAEKIVTKAWGETYASQSRKHIKKGNRNDRRVHVKFYIKKGSKTEEKVLPDGSEKEASNKTEDEGKETFQEYDDSEDESPLDPDEDGYEDEDED
ncbi:MAG: OmpA family protein [Spirochaetota bacterium]